MNDVNNGSVNFQAEGWFIFCSKCTDNTIRLEKFGPCTKCGLDEYKEHKPVVCRNCNHECHCKNKEHIDEYLDICPCLDCNCNKTKDFLEEAKKEQKELDESYRESLRQKRERDEREANKRFEK